MDAEKKERDVCHTPSCTKPADYTFSCTRMWCCEMRFCTYHAVNRPLSKEAKKYRTKIAYWDKKTGAWHASLGCFNDLYCL